MITSKYKLLNQDRTTRNNITWPIGEWKEAKGDPDQPLCTDGWLHCYDDPYLALFLNPIHACIKNPIVCEVEVSGKTFDDSGLKRGYRKMKVVKDLHISQPTIEQRVAFAIYCTLKVYGNSQFKQWAKNWLSGKDRSQKTAMGARRAAIEAAWAAWAAEVTATGAAIEAAEVTAWAAAWAAEVTAWAAWAAWAATKAAAWAAAEAAEAAAWAAAEAAEVIEIDLIFIAHKAMGVQNDNTQTL